MKTLDLHGIKHSNVQSIVDEFIYENMKFGTKEVEIITGLSEQMKRLVRDLTEEYSMDCYDHPTNYGIIIVKLV